MLSYVGDGRGCRFDKKFGIRYSSLMGLQDAGFEGCRASGYMPIVVKVL